MINAFQHGFSKRYSKNARQRKTDEKSNNEINIHKVALKILTL